MSCDSWLPFAIPTWSCSWACVWPLSASSLSSAPGAPFLTSSRGQPLMESLPNSCHGPSASAWLWMLRRSGHTWLIWPAVNDVPAKPELDSPTAVLILWRYLVHFMSCSLWHPTSHCSCRSLSVPSAHFVCAGLGLLSSFMYICTEETLTLLQQC